MAVRGSALGIWVIAEIFPEVQNKNSIFSNDGKKSVVFEYVVNVDIPNDAPTLEWKWSAAQTTTLAPRRFLVETQELIKNKDNDRMPPAASSTLRQPFSTNPLSEDFASPSEMILF